ncbi:MAG: T9SS type A sorting domain-containing protein, partial [Flavobacteriales bacterium]
ADYYVYEENNGDQVYYYANNQFYKLYDFAAQINDTWEVYNANFEITCIPNTGMVKVIATGTENIDGEDLKYIELNYVSGGADLSGKVYQKIGAIDRFFMPDYAAYTPECGYLPEDALLSNELLCFEDTNFLFNNGENACYEIILSNDDYEYSDSRLKIYKSNQKVVFLNNKTVLEFKVIIFDSDGKKVLSKTKKNTNKIEVNLNLTGVYFSIVELDGITYNKKIILRD